MILFTEEKLVQQHIGSVANLFAGLTGSGFNAAQVRRTTFLMVLGAGGVGTGDITVQASATANMASPTPVPFKYRVQSTATSSDAYASGYNNATTAGFTTAVGANQLVIIEVDSRDIPDGYQFIAVKTVQNAAGAVVGSVIAIGNEPMFVGSTPPSTFS